MKCFSDRDTKTWIHNLIATVTVIVVVLLTGMSCPTAVGQNAPQYELTWVDNTLDPTGDIRLKDINDSGIVVGKARVGGTERAILFEQSAGLQDINDLSLNDWIDLDGQGGSQLTSAWFARRANGINSDGQIVGHATHIAGLEADRVFILNDPLGPNPEFTLLPRFGSDANFGSAINDLGVVVGGSGGHTIVFDPLSLPVAYAPISIPTPVDYSGTRDPQAINNLGVIVTRVSLESEGSVISPSGVNPDGSFDYAAANVDVYLGNEFYGINDSGMISGLREPVTSGKPANRIEGGAIRFQYPGVPDPADLLIVDNGNPEAYFCDINEFGDVCFAEGSRGWVYLNGEGVFNLDNYIAFDSAQDESDWLSTKIQPQGINEIGQIILRTWADRTPGVLLTPIEPGPGVTVSQASDLTTTESGDTATFAVVLDTQPSADVFIDLTTDNPNEGLIDDPVLGLVSTTSLTFTQSNWDDPQTVTIEGVDDQILDGDQPYTIFGSASSGDQDYDGINVEDVSVTNEDDETPPGGGTTDYPGNITNLRIPDNNSTGISDSIEVGSHAQIISLTVNVVVSHSRASDLDGWLLGPEGEVIPLTIANGSNDYDVTGAITDPEGTWTLQIWDDRRKKVGDWNSWQVTIEHN